MIMTKGDTASYHAALQLPFWVVDSYEKTVQKWLMNNGEEWTVNRLKMIYTDFIRYRAGVGPVGSWYQKNKEGLPSGFWSYLFRTARKSKKLRFSCAVLLRSYTRFILPEANEVQLEKFLKGVSSEDIAVPSSILNGVATSVFKVGRRFEKFSQPSYLSYSPSPGRRLPDAFGKTFPEDTHWQFQWETIMNTKTGRRLYSDYRLIFDGVFQHMTFRMEGNNSLTSGIDSVGKIGLIQEPGHKLRAVANPNRVYQVALKPLGDQILKTLAAMPWDCTFDQSKSFPVIQLHLKQQKRVHCVDLTGATDYFPLSLQLHMLHLMFPLLSNYIDLFRDISRSPWIFNGGTIKWTKGQPLGLFPSFGAFALTHGLLLYHLNNYKHENAFFVLGDDVIILDDALALRYYSALKALQCPISETKSITSTVMGEFGGKLIFADHVEPQLKWRQLSDDNFVDIVKLLGKRALRLLRPQQRKVVKLIWDIPDLEGGLGFNPDGLPYETRYQKYLELFGDDVSTFLTSYDRKFQNYFNVELVSPSKRIYSKWNGESLPDLDQRSAALVSKYLPLFIKMYGILGTNLYSVVPDKDILPISGFEGKRSTLLDVLQRKLGIR